MRSRQLPAAVSLGFASALALLCGPALAAAGQVSITVSAPDNLADAAQPIPILHVRNDSPRAIALYVFMGAPDAELEYQSEDGAFEGGDGGRCGNGFVLRRLAPRRRQSFRLWSRVGNGPGRSGTYRVRLWYSTVKTGVAPATQTVVSPPFALHYGDRAPRAGSAPREPARVVLTDTRFEPVDAAGARSHAPAVLAEHFRPGIDACLTAARIRLPWIRGAFTLVAYRFPGDKPPVTYVDTSLLGDPTLNQCLAQLEAPATLVGQYYLTFRVSRR